MGVSVPVDYATLKNVTNVTNLTMAKVVTNADGTTSLVYVGGSYDKTTGTFNAKVDTAGDYILVEKDDLVKIELNIDKTATRLNDVPDSLDVPAEINSDNRTMLPLRYIGEALGYEVEWQPDGTVTLTNGVDSLNMKIGEILPGFDTKVVVKDGRTLAPARYVSEKLGAYVIWDPVAQQVVITK